MISFSKCKKCGAIKNIGHLVETPGEAGKVCQDEEACKKQEHENIRNNQSQSVIK